MKVSPNVISYNAGISACTVAVGTGPPEGDAGHENQSQCDQLQRRHLRRVDTGSWHWAY